MGGGVEILQNYPHAPANNGYLNDVIVFEDNSPSAQRDTILRGIIERDLRRPAHNVMRNAQERE